MAGSANCSLGPRNLPSETSATLNAGPIVPIRTLRKECVMDWNYFIHPDIYQWIYWLDSMGLLWWA